MNIYTLLPFYAVRDVKRKGKEMMTRRDDRASGTRGCVTNEKGNESGTAAE